MKNLGLATLTACAFLAATGTQAATNLLTDGSFELAGNYGTGYLPGWEQFNVESDNGPPGPEDGVWFAAFLAPFGVLIQNFFVVPDRLYTLTFWVRLDGASPDTFEAEINNTPEITIDTGTGGLWKEYSVNFTSNSFGGESLEFIGTGSALAFLDNVSVFADTPEPTTWALMLAGFAGLGAALRSRRMRTLATSA